MDRRRFLTAAALTAGAAALPGGFLSGKAAAAVPPQITLPDRGVHDTSPAASWTDGFLTGNGEYGAILHGAATLEKVVFNYHRLVLPNGTRTVKPPVISGRLEGVRDKALAGDYAGANSDFASGWSLRWTQTYHPAYERHIATPGMTTVNDYGRVDDFRTGEVSSSWTDQYGTWTHRAFVSRPDSVIVHELIPAPGRTVDTILSVNSGVGTPALRRPSERCRSRAPSRTFRPVGATIGRQNALPRHLPPGHRAALVDPEHPAARIARRAGAACLRSGRFRVNCGAGTGDMTIPPGAAGRAPRVSGPSLGPGRGFGRAAGAAGSMAGVTWLPRCERLIRLRRRRNQLSSVHLARESIACLADRAP